MLIINKMFKKFYFISFILLIFLEVNTKSLKLYHL